MTRLTSFFLQCWFSFLLLIITYFQHWHPQFARIFANFSSNYLQISSYLQDTKTMQLFSLSPKNYLANILHFSCLLFSFLSEYLCKCVNLERKLKMRRLAKNEKEDSNFVADSKNWFGLCVSHEWAWFFKDRSHKILIELIKNVWAHNFWEEKKEPWILIFLSNPLLFSSLSFPSSAMLRKCHSFLSWYLLKSSW